MIIDPVELSKLDECRKISFGLMINKKRLLSCMNKYNNFYLFLIWTKSGNDIPINILNNEGCSL